MQVKDLIVTGDARILGNLYASGGQIAGGKGDDEDGSKTVTYSAFTSMPASLKDNHLYFIYE